ncbi:pyridoxal-phosphate dependent enzyme [Streptomyces nodosus]|uniref:pyridoxal-phosphate dependent enzyme n=1 Tax=Streptomyces nodosus TaxID=40318 RepID=UPI0037F8A5BB
MGLSAGILGTIGDTTLVQLSRVADGFPGQLLAKLVGFNPTGSAEDRSAVAAVDELLRRGELVAGTTMVAETGSADFTASLTQVCRSRQVELVCVVSPAVESAVGGLLRAYGGRVEVPDGAAADEPGRAAFARDLAARIGGHWPGSHGALRRAESDRRAAREILQHVDGPFDLVICDADSPAVLRGCADQIRLLSLATELVAVHLVDEADAPMPADPGVAGVCHRLRIDRTTAARACRRLVEREAILAGPRSGAALAAFEQLADGLAPDAKVVLLFPDKGHRHLDSIYS